VRRETLGVRREWDGCLNQLKLGETIYLLIAFINSSFLLRDMGMVVLSDMTTNPPSSLIIFFMNVVFIM